MLRSFVGAVSARFPLGDRMNDEQYIPDDTNQIRAMVAAVTLVWMAGLFAGVSVLV